MAGIIGEHCIHRQNGSFYEGREDGLVYSEPFLCCQCGKFQFYQKYKHIDSGHGPYLKEKAYSFTKKRPDWQSFPCERPETEAD